MRPEHHGPENYEYYKERYTNGDETFVHGHWGLRTPELLSGLEPNQFLFADSLSFIFRECHAEIIRQIQFICSRIPQYTPKRRARHCAQIRVPRMTSRLAAANQKSRHPRR